MEARQQEPSLPMRLLEYWHLLSLDAPTVAMVWSWAFAQAVGVTLPPLSPVLLGLATWLLYVADRLLDGVQSSHVSMLRERHHFHARHRVTFIAVAMPAAGLLCWLVVTRMDRAPRFEDLLLSACAGIYLLWVHLPAQRMRLFPKEAAVAIVFAIACVIPAWSRRPASHPWLLGLGILFALLCWLNCTAIEIWESGAGAPDLRPFLHSVKHLRTICFVLAAAAFLPALFCAANRRAGFTALYICIATSALMLGGLDRAKLRVRPVPLRAAADAVLLTPVVLLLIHSLSHLL